jgi:drug/metabolite transporter (DMT)-like permease
VVVVFGALAGACFGAFPLAVRHALARYRDAEVAATLFVGLGCVVTAAAAAFAGALSHIEGAWAFCLIGALTPGLMQPLSVRSVREAGAARASVAISTAPLLSVALAVVLLDEHLSLAGAIGVLLIVAGCMSLAREGQRPADFRAVGLVLAFAAAALLAARDNLVRSIAAGDAVAPLGAATMSLAGGFVALLLYLALSQRRRALGAEVREGGLRFVLPGLLMGGGTASLYVAFAHGPVTTVAPLNATGALWTVVLAAFAMRHGERVTRQLALAAALVVAGGVLIGARL